MTGGPRVGALVEALERERAAFVAALGALPDPEGRAVVESWDARDLVVHAAFWSEHGANAVELAAAGRGHEFAYDNTQTDAMNAATAAAGHASSLADARTREDAAFERFRDAVAALDEGLLDLELGNGDTVEAVIRYDGPDHYTEHAAHLRYAMTAP
ncbi:MAG TPA: maleylpyruvate isomerase N-terminal domain-containing protein [Candidatus Limnocylindria bacterium]|nr:maleylpyruvate isomerase N-terminal domain-containing protein [Candidatus Limnocylindria bacterium]